MISESARRSSDRVASKSVKVYIADLVEAAFGRSEYSVGQL
jgi:hypothetical protein